MGTILTIREAICEYWPTRDQLKSAQQLGLVADQLRFQHRMTQNEVRMQFSEVLDEKIGFADFDDVMQLSEHHW